MKSRFRRIAVYCSSSTRLADVYFDAARQVGRALAERGIGIVYGGGRVGMMGALADGALAAGGEVIGVITQQLNGLEVGHTELSEMYVTASMQSRKTMMAQLADAFLALPGGWGTLDELFEATTWAQLNYHRKPVGMLDVNGYFERLFDFLSHAESEGFIRPTHHGMIQQDTSFPALLAKLEAAEIPQIGSWKA